MHLGVLTSPVPGHLNPLCSLGRELQRRGHRVTVFHIEDVRGEVLRQGVGFQPVGASDFPPGAWERSWHPLAEARGLSALLATLRVQLGLSEMTCRDVPAEARRLGVDALLVDQIVLEGASLAEHLGIPFVNVCCTVPLNGDRTGQCPPIFAPWAPRDSGLQRLGNRLGHGVVELLSRPALRVVNRWRRRWGLTPHRRVDDVRSPLATLSPFPAELDFPNPSARGALHYTGPLVDGARPGAAFPWERLDGRPLVYASLGTLLNRFPAPFRLLAEACAPLDVQLVLSKGAWRGGAVELELPGSPLVVDFAPQLEVLERARLCLTHAGANTVLEALSRGVPLVMMPMNNDQPAVAARVAHAGAGVVVPAGRVTPERLRAAVERVLRDEAYRAAAGRMREAIVRAGGVKRAADVVEQAVATRQPVPVPAAGR